jgi:hypothetical protein
VDLKSLDIYQIGKAMESYLKKHFSDCIIIFGALNMFSETVRLSYDEIVGLIPFGQEQSLDESGWFCGASGFIWVINMIDGSKLQYTTMLLMDEWQENALLFYISRWDVEAKVDVYTLIKDFTKGV